MPNPHFIQWADPECEFCLGTGEVDGIEPDDTQICACVKQNKAEYEAEVQLELERENQE